MSALPALVGLAGALAFAAINVASTIFYEPLGVTPSDVGLGYGELLARVAVIVSIVGATALVAIVLVSLAVWAVAGRLENVEGRRAKLLVGLLGASIILLFDVIVVALPPLSFEPSWADLFGMVMFSGLVAVGVVIGIALWNEDLAGKWSITRNGVLIVTGVWLLLAPLSFVAHALEGTREVQDGHRQRSSMFGAPFPWQVTVVSLRWSDPAPELVAISDCLLYLGSSGDSAVFYYAAGRRSIRASAGDVIIELLPERTSCAGPR